MNDAPALVARYLETWNETDDAARLAAVAGVWAEHGTYTDPLADVAGHDAIAGLVGALQAQVPGHVFRPVEQSIDSHGSVLRFQWELVPAAGGEPLAVGFDVAATADDGRIATVIGFLDKAPGA
ncbi:MAG TPA: nuclear transport factor 2 family protein [Gaiellales bacterium]